MDVERARTETRSVPRWRTEPDAVDDRRLPAGLLEPSGFKLGVNYGWNKVRFPAPVPACSRIRASVETLAVDEVGGGWHRIIQKWTVEVDGSEKPACVAESVGRVLV